MVRRLAGRQERLERAFRDRWHGQHLQIDQIQLGRICDLQVQLAQRISEFGIELGLFLHYQK
ncbi:MAG: hypothetical protein ACREJM_11370, partial [Candidatus Saccharimonadales bacterium]